MWFPFIFVHYSKLFIYHGEALDLKKKKKKKKRGVEFLREH